MPLLLLFAWGGDNLTKTPTSKSTEIESDESPVATIPLRRYWNGITTDYLTIAQPIVDLGAPAQGYMFQGIEGHIFPVQQPDTVPLKLFWNAKRKDYLTTTANAVPVGYVMVRVEGFVFTNQHPGTVPLRLFWRAEWQDFFATTGNPGFGYVHIGIVGYVFP